MTNIEKLETEIRKALPELMELSEGCKVYYDGQVFTINQFTTVDRNIIYNEITKDHLLESEYDIIGHPVTIIHLLRWLDTIGWAKLYTSGVLYMRKIKNVHLDLTKPLLSQQSEEVINELVKLVK